MKYEARTLATDAGLFALRSPEGRDARARMRFLKAVSGETPYMARETDDSPEDAWLVSELLEDQLEDGAVMEIAAFLGEEMVACGSLGPVARAYPRKRHRALFGICVRRDFWSQGLGGAILGALIEKAPELGYSQIELNVAAENLRARRLYARYGFAETGCTPNALRGPGGAFMDEIQMIRMV